jgi:hypothetical protein
MDSANLYVSIGFREIALPTMEIGSVKELRWIKAHPIIIGFKNATAYGTGVMFKRWRNIVRFQSVGHFRKY